MSSNSSYFKGLYVHWNKLKAVMLKFISWCTLDKNTSIDNCSLLKLHQAQTLQKVFGQYSK